ncbi:serine/threonine-protein kinase [Listeria cossartiae subsp. cayugensis]|uniref:non-specific serine/threonine protein kinase n=1 Tax=Listeria cossartiae subsp. cayugensis TaxID=2713505 RepID=A0ABU2ILQ7_9LIST|nr:serine/threonine-protein kinase [Listeria cossartiae]MDT0049128.1 serine/threonine-protein kinase [Listeria cossartiae subsp. cayugensis]MDT0065631.1 serine/threonine-protein kinase [Listeria cossartiae subsp. cayugensis]MDT0078765.1 serine/threonine-protein kinase [Listeria cossartiae subsp. cayugensis]MDT0081601.1 serine/threonine-protein kinase [Listeria cossartiae subsp. cayugensis]MDT0087864.1 serine/threonine-protein kinase [Listeria cossartiae subsp. cayugensis]
MGEMTLAFIEEQYKELDNLNNKENPAVLTRNTSTGELFVRKIIPISFAPVIEQLKDLSSNYLPKIDVMIPNGNQLIVYEEYINGKNLADLMKTTATFDADEVTRLMLMLSDALTELHANAIIHRDIKPSNIMISNDGVLKLIDFDASRVFEVGKNQDTVNLGTIGYAAPEQYGYSQTDARSDIYSIGVLMLELLLGKNTMPDKEQATSLEKIAMQAAAFDPEQRYQSIQDFRTAVKNDSLGPSFVSELSDFTSSDDFDTESDWENVASDYENDFIPWYKHIPGFRTGKPWKMVVAVLGYIFMAVGLFSPPSDDSKMTHTVNFFNNFLLIVPAFVIFTNLCGIWSKLPLLKSSSPGTRRAGIAIYIIICITIFGVYNEIFS